MMMVVVVVKLSNYIPVTSRLTQRLSLNVSRDWTLHVTSSALLTSPRHVELSANRTRTWTTLGPARNSPHEFDLMADNAAYQPYSI